VANASPHKLIALLYDGALVAIANASVHLERGDILRAVLLFPGQLPSSMKVLRSASILTPAANWRKTWWPVRIHVYRLLSANIKAAGRTG